VGGREREKLAEKSEESCFGEVGFEGARTRPDTLRKLNELGLDEKDFFTRHSQFSRYRFSTSLTYL
jgi:hypothetical protein